MKNCFIDNKPNYLYDITYDGLKIATGKLLNQYKKALLSKRNIQSTLDLNGKRIDKTITTDNLLIVDFIYAALDS